MADYGVVRGRETPGLNSQSFRVTEVGLARIQTAVGQLLGVDKDRAIRSGLRAMGNIFVRGGRQRLRTRLKDTKGGTGNLYRAFRNRVKKMKPGLLVGFAGGVKGGSHSHLVDRGTTRRPHPITGTSGVMPANNFWTDTATEEWNKASNVLFDAIEKAVNRIIERNAY